VKREANEHFIVAHAVEIALMLLRGEYVTRGDAIGFEGQNRGRDRGNSGIGLAIGCMFF
jgi:hypothetical protein